MGVSYEMNWYLVAENEDKIIKLEDDYYKTVKKESRIYPVGSQIPLILKDQGCIGMIEVEEFQVTKDMTEIKFKWFKEFELSEEIKKHYNDMYLYMKK